MLLFPLFTVWCVRSAQDAALVAILFFFMLLVCHRPEWFRKLGLVYKTDTSKVHDIKRDGH